MQIGDIMYLLHKNNVWGAGVLFALPGNPDYASAEQPNNLPERVSSQTMALSIDLETNCVYANDRLVTMLSSEAIYGTNLWKGFTTDECLLTIEGMEYNASSLNLAITKIGEDVVAEDGVINSQFSENEFRDTQAPVISVEMPADKCPSAIAGMAYLTFKASAVDDYTKSLTVKTEVFYNFGTDKQIQLCVENAAFVPFQSGIYTIVYSSVDAYGNVGKTTISVTADEANAETLKVQLGDLHAGVTGSRYELTVPAFTNNRGEVTWSAVAKLSGTDVSYSISADKPYFFPEYAGTYEVVYTFKDYVYAGSATKALTINAGDQPTFMEQPVLPQYILKGCVYELPHIDARIYSSGKPVAAVPQIYVVEDGGAEKLADYRYVSYAKTSVQIVYRLENNGKVTEYKSDVIPVLDVGYNGIYDINKY